MDDREFELMLSRLLRHCISVGTETFRDTLLARCLAVLNAGDEPSLVDDEDLELLAAAGDMTVLDPTVMGDNGGESRPS